MRPNLNRKAVTLLELIIAMSLLLVVVLAIGSIQFFSRYHLSTSVKRAQLQNDLSFAIEHMGKNIASGVGNIIDPPLNLTVDPNGDTILRVRVDLNNPPTPANLTDDTWVNYTYDAAGHQLAYEIGSNSQLLSSRITNFTANLTYENSTVDLSLTARFNPDPAKPASMDNPEMTMNSTLYSRSASAH